jgi:hypothetical protein
MLADVASFGTASSPSCLETRMWRLECGDESRQEAATMSRVATRRKGTRVTKRLFALGSYRTTRVSKVMLRVCSRVGLCSRVLG